MRVPSSADEVEGVTPSAPCVGGVDGSLAVGVAVVEGEPPGCGAVGGCVLGSEVACFPEHAANVRAVREERVRAVRRLTGLIVYFIRT